jgi:hypothetical protein
MFLKNNNKFNNNSVYKDNMAAIKDGFFDDSATIRFPIVLLHRGSEWGASGKRHRYSGAAFRRPSRTREL